MARTSQDLSDVAQPVSAPLSATGPFRAPPAQGNKDLATGNFQSLSHVAQRKSDIPLSKRHLAPHIELTGAGAAADNESHRQELERQPAVGISPNPAHTARISVMSHPTSKPSDAPAALSPTKQSTSGDTNGGTEPGFPTSDKQQQRQQSPPQQSKQAEILDDEPSRKIHQSPQSLQTNLFATPNHFTEQNVQEGGSTGKPAVERNSKKRPLSPSSHEPSPTYGTYPPATPSGPNPHAARNASLPNIGGRSSNTKKHRCPHCSTEFTRHHNLKSHLLTHSQEKPFNCNQCEARFRRLHDLKRHAKLHTGERSHVCPICHRAFARGDALNRHKKGPGGCAGRRESGVDEDDIDGLEDVDMEDGEPDTGKPGSRRRSEPHKRPRRGSTHMSSGAPTETAHGSTYPPVAPMTGSAHAYYPPPSTTPSSSSARFNPASYQQSPNVYSHGSMTESPKALSPGQPDLRPRASDASMGRSPSISTRMQQQNMLRSNTGTGLSPSGRPQLPSIQTSDSRFPPPAGGRLPPPIMSTQGPTTGHLSGPPSAGPVSASSHHQNNGNGVREVWGAGAPPADQRLLDYIGDMSERIRVMEEERSRERQELDRYRDEMDRLRAENENLRQQLRPAHPQTQHLQQPPQPVSLPAPPNRA